jgi:2-polyprenyl-3-methyl-5-hydroxy-6-metoxy-1,4-benzoquinol methylase
MADHDKAAGSTPHDAPAEEGIATGRTDKADYAARLERLELAGWKRLLDVQRPYRWNIRRLNLGRTLDVGCGIGRNLLHLGGNGVGVDHNETSVQLCRERGLTAYTIDEFFASTESAPGSFDSMLVAHVVEHMPEPDAVQVVKSYLECVKPGGNVVFITPQERGYASDATHVRFVGFPEQRALADTLGLTVRRQYSFPLPRFAGKLFTYNEFVAVTTRS